MSSEITPAISQGVAAQVATRETQNTPASRPNATNRTDTEARNQLHAASQASSATLKQNTKADKSPRVPKQVEKPYDNEGRKQKPAKNPRNEEEREEEEPSESRVDLKA